MPGECRCSVVVRGVTPGDLLAVRVTVVPAIAAALVASRSDSSLASTDELDAMSARMDEDVARAASDPPPTP